MNGYVLLRISPCIPVDVSQTPQFKYASLLDESQRRTVWLADVHDGIDDAGNPRRIVSSSRYNWSFIRQLRKDLRAARVANDPIRGLAVIQQCTRKNVGGVMSEDLFSYSNTGETKHIGTWATLPL
jgi:Domain of unknown function (DUF3336)